MMNRSILFLAFVAIGIPGLVSCKKNMLGGKEVQNFRTGANRDNGKNGRSNILKNSVFVQPLASTPGDHEEIGPSVDAITSAPVVQPSAELGSPGDSVTGDKGAGKTDGTVPLPGNNPGNSTPVPQNPGKSTPTDPTGGNNSPQTNPTVPTQPGSISIFPTRKVCSDRRFKYHGFALRNMNPKDLQFAFFPIKTSADVKPFFVQGNASVVADIVNTGHVGMDLSSVPDGTYNLLLCNRSTECRETKFLSEHSKLASFQKDLYRDYASEYSRAVAERTTKFSKKFEKNADNHHRYRDGIMDDRRGVFGGAPRIVIQNGQIRSPSQSYIVKDNGIALLNVNSPPSNPLYEAYTAPQIVLLYNGNKKQVRSATSYGSPSTGKDPCPPGGKDPCSPCPPGGKDPCGGGYPPPPSGGDDCDDTVSPLIVDLDNTGLDLSAPLDGVLFDIEGDGLTDKISWPRGSGANFVALDLNGNGNIDDGTELFGNYTVAPDNNAAANGFLALAKYDDDKDGKITEKDRVYLKLVMWNDANFNGKSEPHELKTLSQLGIKSIDLKYDNGLEEDRYGNQTRERSVIALKDGSLRMVFDIWFRKI